MATTTENQPHEYTFQAEIQQLLHLLAHSLYQSKEIALRELVSNASDALDKMRYVSLTDEAQRDESPLQIVIEGRKDAAELVIRDNGVGMTHDELVTNLGTIAHSGSREFLRSAASREAGSGSPDLSLIGQFGVGFYSAFMIADKVRVRTRSHREEQGWQWESDGTGKFRVEPATDLPRGTEVVLHLKDDAKHFAEEWQIKNVIRRYSGFVPHPILLGDLVINSQKPIWVEPKNQVTEEQYVQFYQHLTHRPEERPLWHIHLAADSPIQFRAVLYCPPISGESMGLGRESHGLSLCAKRVLVQSDCRDILPEYLRFLFGIVDSEDLPLNVSRETLQDNTIIRRIRGSLMKAVFDRLDQLAEESPADFQTFYRQFGGVLKEGVARDGMNRARVASFLRFTTSKSADPEAPASLADYVGRMVEGQKSIYYLSGPDLNAIRKSPSLEIFLRRGIEVLFLTDPVDEFVLGSLGVFEEKQFVSIDAADVELPSEPEAGSNEPTARSDEQAPSDGMARILALFKEALGDRVKDVRSSRRLTDSPCCLVNAEGGPSAQMQRILKLTHKDYALTPKVLEVNPSAPLIRRLASLGPNPDQDEFIRLCGLQLWSNALLLEGCVLEPEPMAARNQRFMEEAAEKRASNTA